MSYIKTVINSCETQEQLQSCFNWINNLALNDENKLFSMLYLEDKAANMFYNSYNDKYLDFIRLFEQNMEGFYDRYLSNDRFKLSNSNSKKLKSI